MRGLMPQTTWKWAAELPVSMVVVPVTAKMWLWPPGMTWENTGA